MRRLTIVLQTVAVRMIHYRKDPYSHFELGDFFTVGGVLVIEVKMTVIARLLGSITGQS